MEIKKELEGLGIHIPDLETAPMSVPDNYFENLGSELLAQMQTEEFLNNLPKTNPYTLDARYFEEFPEQMTALNFIEGLPKENVYTVPEQYFQSLPEQLLQKAKQEKRIQPMRKVSPVFASFSIAASILLVLGIGFLFMQGKVEVNAEQRLAMLPNHEIEQYIQMNGLEYADDLSFHNVEESEVDVNALENDVYNSISLGELTPEEINQYAF